MADDARQGPVYSPPAPKPAHVPDALVYDFDKYSDPALLADPHVRFLDLIRNAPPIFWTPRRGGHWMFISYDAIFEGGRDWEIFSNDALLPQDQLADAKAAMPADAPHIPQLAPITSDPPTHAAYRIPLNPAFSPKQVNLLTDDIRSLARELIAKIAPDGRCEFISAVAEPLPVQIFLKKMGLPLERQNEYRTLVRTLSSSGDSDIDYAIHHFRTCAEIMRPTIEERRREPKDDLISQLWATKIDGKPTTPENLEDYGVMLFLAGLDTVVNAIGFGVRHLAMNPDLQDQLRADPGLYGDVTEELLRRYTFSMATRTVAKDIVFQGVQLKRGDMVNLLLPTADLDASHFDHPARFDLKRDQVHVAFGVGPHRCLGSHLARLELRLLYEELMAGLPTFRLDPQRPPTFHGGEVMGPTTVDLVWDV